MKKKTLKTFSTASLSLCGLISSVALLGCSQSTDNVNTLASKHAMVPAIDNQASRNNGAWGGVYMSREELRAPPTNIVNDSILPRMDNDQSLTKWHAKFEDQNAFVTTDGAKLYHDSCAGCHMHKGQGAQGAGYYPPLANNSKLQSKYYVIDILINGLRGMPSFHRMMSDEQMAAVTQYVLNDLNGFHTTVTAQEVAKLRHDNPPGADPSE